MKHIFLLICFFMSCVTLNRAAFADGADGSIATAKYVDGRIADLNSQVVKNDELKTFSDKLPERFVTTSESQQISGTKTYTTSPIVPTPPLP